MADFVARRYATDHEQLFFLVEQCSVGIDTVYSIGIDVRRHRDHYV